MNKEPGTKNEEQNPKNIIVRNAAGQTRRARKTELKWFAERGFTQEVSGQKSDVSKTTETKT